MPIEGVSFAIGDRVRLAGANESSESYELKAGPYQGLPAAQAAHDWPGVWSSKLPGFDPEAVFWFAQNTSADWLKVIASENHLVPETPEAP